MERKCKTCEFNYKEICVGIPIKIIEDVHDEAGEFVPVEDFVYEAVSNKKGRCRKYQKKETNET